MKKYKVHQLICSVLSLLLLIVPSLAFADTIISNGGNTYVGKITSMSESSVEIETTDGKFQFKRSDLKEINTDQNEKANSNVETKEQFNKLSEHSDNVENTLTTDIDPSLCMDIQIEKIPVSSKRFIKEFEGYSISVTNKCSTPLNLLKADIVKGLSGSQAQQMVKGDLFGSYFWWGLIGAAVTNSRNAKAEKEAIKFTSQLLTGILNVGDTIQTNTITSIGQKPEIKLLLMELKTKELYSVNKI